MEQSLQSFGQIENFHTRKLGEIIIFYAVLVNHLESIISILFRRLLISINISFFQIFYSTAIKGLYTYNFERVLKSMTCVQIRSIHIDGFKNIKKNLKWYSAAMVTNQNPQKGAKNVFTPAKISQVREIVQN